LDAKIGAPVRRKEDARLLTGGGRFSDDVDLPGQLYAAIVRSPHAHARIRGIDKSDALASPGVLLVATGADLVADGIRPIPHIPRTASPPDIPLDNRDGSPVYVAPHSILAVDRARFVGDAVALVVADTAANARTGAERVSVDYEVMPAVTDAAAAAEPGAPILWSDMAGNVCIDADVGDRQAADAAFARATHVVQLDTWLNRVTGVPMEPRAAVAEYDGATGRYTLFAGSGGVVRQKRELAAILGVAEERVRVVAYDVGGNYGTRNGFYPEFALVAWAAKKLGRPVKWTCDRTEAFLSDYHGRDLHVHADLALDAEGRFLAMRGSNLSNIGAYGVSFVPLTKGVEIMTGLYRIPAAYFRARGAYTNTMPTNPYRSAGRPEVVFVLERLVDLAARRCGFDPVELRCKNLIPPQAMPYFNHLGMTYDSGEFAKSMDMTLALADWQGYEARKAASAARGRLRGRALVNYLETSTGAPRERVHVEVKPERAVRVEIGTQSSGQGHETSFAQVTADLLGVPFDSIEVVTGDTDILPVGGGSHSGRSMRLAGIVIGKASDEIVAKGKRIAAQLLEAADADIRFAAGKFSVVGTDRSVDLFEVARAAHSRRDLADDLKGPLAAVSDETVRIAVFPNGCHVCEVEVDPETGAHRIVAYAAVDDVGRCINPLIVDGQTHGGIVQGLGQAMGELCRYDRVTGQALSASFMDYQLPRADEVPYFATEINEVPTKMNPLGVKAGGEGGTTPALAALIGAIVDALESYGVHHIEMPATPERVWRAMRTAKPESN
jgi:carbon-monoxide dehydrogenase large subunit